MSNPYIYRIFRRNTDPKSKGYVGQDSGGEGREYNRIWSHFRTAYGLENTSGAGGSDLVKEFSACDLCINVYEDDCFGAGEKNFLDFSKTWTSTADPQIQRLTFAETMWICAGMINRDSDYNLRIFDRCEFKTDLKGAITNVIQDIYNNEELTLLNLSSAPVKFDEVSMHFPDTKDYVEKLLHPEYYAIVRAFSYCLGRIIFHSKNFKNLVIQILSNGLKGEDVKQLLHSYVNKQKEAQVARWNKNTWIVQHGYQITSANVRFDFEDDIDRVTKWFNKRVNLKAFEMAHSIEDQLRVIFEAQGYDVKTKTFSPLGRETKEGQDTLRIKRNAYVDNMHLQQKSPQWYVNALNTVKTAQPTKKLHEDNSFVNQLKEMSYEALIKIAKDEMKNCPIKNSINLISRNDLNQLIRVENYDRTDTLMSRVRARFFTEGRQMHILNTNWNTYYRQCISIYIANIGQELRVTENQPDDNLIQVENIYGTHYNFKPFTWNWIEINYSETPSDLHYF